MSTYCMSSNYVKIDPQPHSPKFTIFLLNLLDFTDCYVIVEVATDHGDSTSRIKG